MKAMVLLCIYLCGLYANNLDIVDSKGRSFWDKRFVVYDTDTSLIIKTCKKCNWITGYYRINPIFVYFVDIV